MGLFSKIKDILFEEEEEELEVEAPVRKEKVVTKEAVKEPVRYEEEKIEQQPVTEIKPEVKKEEPRVEASREEFLSERDIYREKSRSPFLDFDEEEFSSVLTKPKAKPTNVIEYERKKRTEKRTDYGRYEKTEIKETTEKKKFRPSPIISPVYGILNEDYRIEDIKTKDDVETLDFNQVRKKAFEPEVKKEEPKVDYYEEETVTVKYEEPEEKIKKEKTIDDLLEDTSDEIIKVDDGENKKRSIEYDEIEDNDLDLDFNLEEDAKHAEKIEQEEVKEEKVIENDDTVESDLFDLIDSMYENREDGE